MSARAWAMRTSRANEQHRNFILSELAQGRLRQGWGTLDEQDLRRVDLFLESSQKYDALSDEQKWAWGHARLLGELARVAGDLIKIDDIILVPNVPENGLLTICRVTGPYEYGPRNETNDLRHIRHVKVLTPGGVANSAELVDSDLRGSLTCRSRLWSLDRHRKTLHAIIDRVEKGDATSLREGVDHSTRARRAVAPVLIETMNALAARLGEPLRRVLGKAEWEPAIVDALRPLVREAKIIHTGGASEQGADLEIHYPNPFRPEHPWIFALQVKDYQGEVSETVADQLEQAIISRMAPKTTGRLIGVALASTSATPSAALEDRMRALADKYKLDVSFVQGDELLRALAQGYFLNWRGAPD